MAEKQDSDMSGVQEQLRQHTDVSITDWLHGFGLIGSCHTYSTHGACSLVWLMTWLTCHLPCGIHVAHSCYVSAGERSVFADVVVESTQ